VSQTLDTPVHLMLDVGPDQLFCRRPRWTVARPGLALVNSSFVNMKDARLVAPHPASVVYQAAGSRKGRNAPFKGTFTRGPCSVSSRSTDKLKLTALMIPSPNSSWMSALMVVP
jgi:hypothetical protein